MENLLVKVHEEAEEEWRVGRQALDSLRTQMTRVPRAGVTPGYKI